MEHVVAITGPLRTILERRAARRRLDCELIFHRVSKGKAGQPIKSYTKQWDAALRERGSRSRPTWTTADDAERAADGSRRG